MMMKMMGYDEEGYIDSDKRGLDQRRRDEEEKERFVLRVIFHFLMNSIYNYCDDYYDDY